MGRYPSEPRGAGGGTGTELYLFNDHRYRYEVVPALGRLIRTGTLTPWLADLVEAGDNGTGPWREILLPYLATHHTDLARFCGYLAEDLRYAGAGRPEYQAGGPHRPCPSQLCPERSRCPVHQDRDRQLADAMNRLFEAAVARCCLGGSQDLGPGAHAPGSLTALAGLAAQAAGPIHHLLAALELRGAALGRRPVTGRGIHGWLTVVETVELAERLGEFLLPSHEPTFAGTAAYRRPDPGGQASPPAGEPDRLSLSLIQAVATLAGRAGHGLLLGSGLPSATMRRPVWT